MTEEDNEEHVFGTRYLCDESKTFMENCWDDVQLSEEQRQQAEKRIEQQQSSHMSEAEAERALSAGATPWNKFYTRNGVKFFRDRNWLLREFPELIQKAGGERVSVLEVGCGVGNTALPLITHAKEHNLQIHVHACDFSGTAIDELRKSPFYDAKYITARVWDVTNRTAFERLFTTVAGTIDIACAVFVLSAIAPEKLRDALANIYRLLRPDGGILLIRDYANYDLSQLRFKGSNNVRGDRLYTRGDGTLVYFFEQDELRQHCIGPWEEEGYEIEELQNRLDQKLIVNRKKQITMNRRWLQAKYRRIDGLPKA